MEYSTAHQLAREIKDSEEYITYHRLYDEVMADETVKALYDEFKKLQVSIQLAAMSGKTADAEDMQRFSGISMLLNSKPEVSQYILSEIRFQQMMADIFKILTDAADMKIEVPNIG